MNPYYPIYTEKAECQDCYKCVRQCPVKAINVLNGTASIIEERCVLCGNCVKICPVGAKHIRSDMERAKLLLKHKKRVIVSLAPSFISEFKNVSKHQLIGAIKKLGFYGVSETALGAQEVSAHIAQSLKENVSGVTISSACPTVVQLIKKYYPENDSLLTSLFSPVLAHCIYLRKVYGEDIGIVFISPCISKKSEADAYPEILNLAITFAGLRKWFDLENINPALQERNKDEQFIPESAAEGAMYPVDGGMVAGIKANCAINDTSFMSFSGMEEITSILEDIKTQPDHPLFLELLACKGGCINGPTTECKDATAFKRLEVLNHTQINNQKIPRNTQFSITADYAHQPVKSNEFSEDDIRTVLKKNGKNSITDELNCSGCGYDSCRDFAKAILAGNAEADMCVSYMRQLAHKKTNALLKTMPSAVVIVDENLRVVECNRNFSKILGEEVMMAYEAKPGLKDANLSKLISFDSYFKTVLQTGQDILNKNIQDGNSVLNASIFSIEKNRIVGGIFQDITAPAVQKEQIVSKTKEVIEKNLLTVQKIAYLLGENASETEVLLESITKSLSAEK